MRSFYGYVNGKHVNNTGKAVSTIRVQLSPDIDLGKRQTYTRRVKLVFMHGFYYLLPQTFPIAKNHVFNLLNSGLYPVSTTPIINTTKEIKGKVII